MKLAKDRFRAAINMIINEDPEKAYEMFRNVIDHTIQGFYYMDSNRMTLSDLEAFVQTVQLLIFSSIARFSYDGRSGAFLPFLTLPMKKKAIIATELMDIVGRSLENRKRVKKDWFSSSSDHEGKVQNTLNTILKVTYPFISEGKGWTRSTTKFDLRGNTVNISVLPKYIPMGEEDKTTLILGVYTEKKKCQKVEIWRSKDLVFISEFGNNSTSTAKFL